jgi:Protein of unknown function (DUF1214)
VDAVRIYFYADRADPKPTGSTRQTVEPGPGTGDLAIVLDNSAQRGEFYDELGCDTDTDGARLDGSRDYHLHVPANPPAKLFWSVTVYDVTTRCLIDNDDVGQVVGERATFRLNATHATTAAKLSDGELFLTLGRSGNRRENAT